jgi:bacteriophage exclusion system BrxA-like protein
MNLERVPPTNDHMTYTATITSASLRLRESRIVADLLLQHVTPAEWKQAVIEENVLQMGSVESIKRIARLLRTRLEPLGEGLWEMVRDGARDLATQAVFAGAVGNSRLLGDFMDITLREQRALFATHLSPLIWNEHIAGCRGRDPEMPHWSDKTITNLRSAVFSMLAEAGYLENTRTLRIQNVFVDPQLAAYLSDRGETYVLRCLEVTE